MQDHWLRVGPPTYITSARLAGFKPKASEEEDFVDPQNLGALLTNIPGGHVQ